MFILVSTTHSFLQASNSYHKNAIPYQTNAVQLLKTYYSSVSKVNTTYEYTSHISFKVRAFILKTSAALLISISFSTVMCKRSGTHRSGNLKGDEESVENGTKGLLSEVLAEMEDECFKVTQNLIIYLLKKTPTY